MGQVNFLYGHRDFCQWGISQVYPGPQLSHSDHPEKISVSKLGVIFRGSPLFLALSGHYHVRGISTLNFGPFSTKLGGTVQTVRMTTDPVWAGITENGRFCVRPKSVFLAKNGF